jgi:hypothetical protein
MSVPDMDANGNHPAERLLFGLFPGETACRIPQRREHEDERAARRANLTPAEEAQREARRRNAAQTSVTILGDLVPRPRDEQTSVNVEIATRPRDERTTVTRGELPEPELEPKPGSPQEASAPRTAEPDARAKAKALEALQACGGNWVAAAELLKQWCEQDVALYREVTHPALGSAVWKVIRSVAKRHGFAWKRGGWTSDDQ